MSRPLLKRRIDALEAAFAARKKDPEFLRVLIDELEYRSTNRAAHLKARAERALAELDEAIRHDAPDATKVPPVEEAPAAVDEPKEPADDQSPPASPRMRPRQSYPPISNDPIAILSAWSALEVLSPPAFRRETDLTGGDGFAIAKLDGGALPWQRPGGGRRNYRLYYQVVLGTIKLDEAVAALVARYGDTRPERQGTRGEAVLASVMLDRNGKPVEEPAVAISSFAWGLPKALAGDLSSLGDWQSAEAPLVEQLDRLVRRQNDAGELLPLDMDAIDAAYRWIVSKLGLSQEFVRAPRFAVRSYQYYINKEPPEPLLLNSFFLGDLAAAANLWRSGEATPNLRRYLGADLPSSRRDLLHDIDALREAVAPRMFPVARWPGHGRPPLVLLQQAAVNLATSSLA